MTDLTLLPDAPAEADYPIVAQVCAHWAALRKPGRLPRRDALDPRALADALPQVFLAQLIGPRVARMRLCGHRIEDMLGMELRGMPLTALFAAPARAPVTDALEQVAASARARLMVQGEAGFGQPRVAGQMALLPLTDADGAITRVLGVLERHGAAGRRPRRFTVTDAPKLDAAPAGTPALRVIPGGRPG